MKASTMAKRLVEKKIKYVAVGGYDGFVALQTIPRCDFDTPVVFLNDGRYTGAVHNGRTLSFSGGLDIAIKTAVRF